MRPRQWAEMPALEGWPMGPPRQQTRPVRPVDAWRLGVRSGGRPRQGPRPVFRGFEPFGSRPFLDSRIAAASRVPARNDDPHDFGLHHRPEVRTPRFGRTRPRLGLDLFQQPLLEAGTLTGTQEPLQRARLAQKAPEPGRAQARPQSLGPSPTERQNAKPADRCPPVGCPTTSPPRSSPPAYPPGHLTSAHGPSPPTMCANARSGSWRLPWTWIGARSVPPWPPGPQRTGELVAGCAPKPRRAAPSPHQGHVAKPP